MESRRGQLDTLPWDLTSFVGRDAERARIGELLGRTNQAQVIGLYGIAGIGKTRLARMVARDVATGRVGDFPGGIIWADASSDPLAAVADALAPAGRQPEVERVAAALVARQRTLVMIDRPGPVDDELLDAVSSWLSAGSHAFVISARFATPLRGATRVEVLPLDPADATALLENRCAELALELDHARAKKLASLSGGLPLALELIAGALIGENADEVAERLAASALHLATDNRDVPARHRSLEAAFRDTWRHLDASDREALAIASSFAGPFTSAEFEHVTRTHGAEAELSTIARRGLAISDGQRYRVLRGLREMAHESLEATARERLRRAHAHAMAERCRDEHPPIEELLTAADALEASDPGRLALASHLIELAQRHRRNRWHLAEQLLLRARRLTCSGEEENDRALIASAELARTRGDAESARDWLGQINGEGRARSFRARVAALLAFDDGDGERGGALLEQALELAGTDFERAEALAHRFAVALATRADVDDDDGQSAYERFRAEGALGDACTVLMNLGLAALHRDEHDRGLARLERATDEARAAGEEMALAASFLFRGLAALAIGAADTAVDHLGEAESIGLAHAGSTLWSDIVGYGAIARFCAGAPTARRELASHVDELARRGRPPSWVLFAAYLAHIDDARAAPDLALADGRPLIARAARLISEGKGEPYGLPGRIAARVLGLKRPTDHEAIELHVSDDRRQFRIADERTDLRRRGPLGRIFAALVEANQQGETCSGDELIDHGWPGESIAPESARMRLYNAIAVLRRMGLRGLLNTTARGYLLENVTIRTSATEKI